MGWVRLIPVSIATLSFKYLNIPQKAAMIGKLKDSGSFILRDTTQIMYHRSSVINKAESIIRTTAAY